MKAIDILNYSTEENTTRYKHLTKCHELGQYILSDSKIDNSVKEKLLNTILLHDIGYSDVIKKTGIHSIDGYQYLEDNYKDICYHKAIIFHSDFINGCPDEYKNYVQEIYDSLTDLEFAALIILEYCDTHVDGYGNEVTIEDRMNDLYARYSNNPEALTTFNRFKENALHIERIINRILDILPTLK